LSARTRSGRVRGRPAPGRGRGSDQHRAVSRAKNRARPAGVQRGYVYLHSAVDGFSRLAYTEPLADEKGHTAAAFLTRAKVWFAAHGITRLHRVVTDNGACYRSGDFARIVGHHHPPPQDQTVHAQAQRKGRALPAHPRRGTALRTRVQLRGRTISSHRCVEHPLQLPSTAQHRGRPTASNPAQHRRHQRPALVHLVGSDPDRRGHVGSTCPGVARHLCLRDVDVNGG
jgi:hypothetical protein